MLEFAEAARARRPGALRPHLDRVRRRHPRGPLRRMRPRRRPGVPQLLRALEVRGRAAGALAGPGCRSRSCARASSSATAAAAGRRPSTSSTGRCGRSRVGCSRPCRRSRRRRSTWSRSTTWPTPIHALCEGEGGIGETYHLTAGADASTIDEIAQLASRYFRRPVPRVLSPAEFAALECSAAEALGARGRPRLLPVLLDRRPCSTRRRPARG